MTRTEALGAVVEAARRRLAYETKVHGAVNTKDPLWYALAHLDALPATSEGWRHKKRGTTYRIIGEASSQVVGEPIGEGDIVVVYRADADGALWVRRKDEFYDGRFERIPPRAEEGEPR